MCHLFDHKMYPFISTEFTASNGVEQTKNKTTNETVEKNRNIIQQRINISFASPDNIQSGIAAIMSGSDE